LGGGSSDGAAVLSALAKHYKFPISDEKIFQYALELGSDVPFFLKGGTALVKGRGEVVNPVQSPPEPMWFLLVHPEIHCSTKELYKALDENPSREHPSPDELIGNIKNGNLKNIRFYNAFEVPVFTKYPELSAIKAELIKAGFIDACMTGSGSNIFALGESEEHVEFLTKTLIENISNFPKYTIVHSIL
jgi:4-diphosphocytidyl-2-C-methyl-D-erythritol kinase